MPPTVMIADDDADFRELITLCLESWGYLPVVACDCREAQALAKRNGAVGLVLLDYFMPGPPPRVCVEQLRRTLQPAVPVVLVSAAVDIRQRADELGLSQYLAKPFDLQALRKLLAEKLGPGSE